MQEEKKTTIQEEKKAYETPTVTKVEFDAADRITASGCTLPGGLQVEGEGLCFD